MNSPSESSSPLTHLGELSIEQFLQEYWQQKPLLIKNAFPNFTSPLDANELAGLSLEEESQSRLVIQNGKDWHVEHGPLKEESFSDLPETNWSLLVQHVDSLDPEVNALLGKFRFLPNWRLDDIMISYATNNGGVGPHFDYYDVFLLQGEGKRRWRIGQRCDHESELVPEQPMKILETFECTEDWEVEAGDMIYIPAKIAHWGEAIGESITYSIGFRAPSHSELLLDSTQHFNAELTEDQRYKDGDEIFTHSTPGLIPGEAISKLQHDLIALISDKVQLAHWLAETSTQLKAGIQPELLPLDFASEQDCREGRTVALSPFCRAAHINVQPQPACYINGQCYSMSLSLAERLSGYAPIETASLNAKDLDTLSQLCDYSLLVLSE